MEKQKKELSVKEQKAIMDKKLIDLNTRLMTAKNEYFRVLVYIDMQDIMLAESMHWAKIAEGFKGVYFEEIPAELEEAQKQIKELDSFVLKIQAEIEKEKPKALEIQKAMLNSFDIKEPKIK